MDAFLFDLDGTLYQDGRAIPGAIELLEQLRERGVPHAFVTNTVSRTPAEILEAMGAMGLPALPEQLVTPTAVLVDHLREKAVRRVTVEDSPAVRAQLGAFDGASPPEVVVVADDGEGLGWETINRIIAHAAAGAEIVTLLRNKVYAREGRLVADLGFYVAGLEYVLGRPIPVFGKPSERIFRLALRRLGDPDRRRVAMVGDDLEFDVLAPQGLGFVGVLVKTGKYRPRSEESFDGVPHHSLSSVAEVSRLF